jgi:stage II sporulation protein AA (anti-sigma F factor antagonist)
MNIIAFDDGATARVVLDGHFDNVGAQVVAVPLATLAGAKQGMIIDMSGVSFIASIGIRHLVSAAKALSRRGGRLVLLNPTNMVTDVLETSGLTDLLPIAQSEAAATAAVSPNG